MLTPDQMSAAMGAARDQVLALCRDHERQDHGGRPCPGNRASAVAFLAHALGVRGAAWDYARQLLAGYDAACEGGGGCDGHDDAPGGEG